MRKTHSNAASMHEDAPLKDPEVHIELLDSPQKPSTARTEGKQGWPTPGSDTV